MYFVMDIRAEKNVKKMISLRFYNNKIKYDVYS